MNNNNEYQLSKIISEIEQRTGRNTELISLYVPPDYRVSEVISHISQEISEAANIKSKSTRKNVESALRSMKSRIKDYSHIPNNGMVIFSGVDDSQTSSVDTVVIDTLPQQVSSFVYRCDSEFYVEPLKEFSSDNKVFGLIVLDRRDAQIGRLDGSNIEKLKELSSLVPGKQKAGGQSQARFERLRKESIDKFFQDVADAVNNIFYDERHTLDGIVIGGPSPTKENFVNSGHLHHEIEDNILGIVDVSDTKERGLKELVEKSTNLFEESHRVEQENLVEEFMSRLSSNEPVTYGVEETIRSIEYGAAEKVLISEEVDYKIESTGDNIMDFTVSDSGEDIVSYVSEAAGERGAEVKIIKSDFEKGDRFYEAFSGIGALLRFGLDN